MDGLVGVAESYLFDDSGRCWRLIDPGLRRSLRTDLPLPELRDFAIRNLGFVEARCWRGRLVITFRRKIASEIALAALMYWLDDEQWQGSLVLRLIGSSTVDEIIASPAALARRLRTMTVADALDEQSRFKRWPLAAAQAEREKPIGRLLELWRSSPVRSQAEVAAFCRAWFHGRFTIVHQTEMGEFVIDETGSGYRCYDRSYVTHSAGSRLIDEPDCLYGHWVSGTYREVALVATPQCDDVAARIEPPRRQAIEVEYRRIIAPFVTSDAGHFLVSASVLRDSA
jgi:hypothetical protein